MKTYDVDNDPKDQLDLEFNYNPNEAKELNSLLNGSIDFSIADLRRVALWKIDRVLDIEDKVINEIKKWRKEKI